MANKSFENANYWSDAWIRHIETYLSSPPRCGIWLKNYFSNKKYSFLECAGGSCRDSRYLHDNGFDSIGSDFDEKTIDYVRYKFKASKFKVQVEDGFNLSFDSSSIDVVFHNGFWVCFDSDDQIIQLLNEQDRVSNRYIVALIHNAANKKLVDKFKDKSITDDLYQIRFFDINHISKIVKNSGIKYKKIKFEKFGGPVDILYGFEKRIPALSPLIRWMVPKLYRLQPWTKVERIAMVIKLAD